MKIIFPKNWKQKILAVIGVVIQQVSMFFCLWQLDLLLSHYIWSDPVVYNSLWTINYELFPLMTRGYAYDLLFASLVAGVEIGSVIAYLSLWFWDD